MLWLLQLLVLAILILTMNHSAPGTIRQRELPPLTGICHSHTVIVQLFIQTIWSAVTRQGYPQVFAVAMHSWYICSFEPWFCCCQGGTSTGIHYSYEFMVQLFIQTLDLLTSQISPKTFLSSVFTTDINS